MEEDAIQDFIDMMFGSGLENYLDELHIQAFFEFLDGSNLDLSELSDENAFHMFKDYCSGGNVEEVIEHTGGTISFGGYKCGAACVSDGGLSTGGHLFWTHRSA